MIIRLFVLYHIFIGLVVAEADPLPLAEYTIFGLIDKNFIGDTNQILGVAEALKKKGGKITFKPISEVTTPLSLTKKSIIISSGSYGLEGLKKIKKDNSHIFCVHLSHRLLKDYEKYTPFIDLFVLPKHEISIELSQKNFFSKIFPVQGVCHNLQKEDLIRAFEENKALLPNASSYCVIILGGDVLSQDGVNWNLFTNKDAEFLANKVAPIIRKNKRHLIILNSPRTGRHIKYQESSEKTLTDAVTESFVQRLKKLKIEKFTLFDYKRSKINPYKSLLYLIANNKNSLLILPGESVSMISEVKDYIPTNNIIVYTHGAMELTHYLYVQSLSSNKIDISKKIKLKSIGTAKSHQQESERVADQILSKVLIKN